MFQETLFRANTSSHIVLRVGIVATLIFASQGFGATSRAEANTLANVYEAVSVSVAYGVGDRVCGIPCGAVAAAATVVVNDNAAKAAESTANQARSSLQQIFGFWGFH